MKKNVLLGVFHRMWPLPKLLLIMKLVFFIMTCMLMHAYGATYAQRVTIMEKNAPLEHIIKSLRKQTGYDFLLDRDIFKQYQSVSVDLKNVSLPQALQSIVKGRKLSFSIEGRSVVITAVPGTKMDQEGTTDSNNLQRGLAGLVVGDKSVPLAGATVKIKNTDQSTATDNKGFFRFDQLRVNEVLEVSYVGYETVETVVTAGQLAQKEYMIITMRPLLRNLDEVTIVNTGFQKIGRENITGAVTTVSSREIEKRNTVNVMDNLEGVVPGLVQYQGKATIRGTSTMAASTGILVVVDGLPIEGSIADVNPYDVESVTVLKDAAAAAIYGARASNGVIVVSTKKATEKGRTAVEASANVTVTEKPEYSYNNYMSPREQVDWESNYYKWWFSGGDGSVKQPIQDFENNINTGQPVTPVQYAYYQLATDRISQSELDAILNNYRRNDFAKEYHEHALLKGVLQQYNLALRTNSGKAQNSFVLNYTNDNKGLINAFDRRLNLHYKGGYSVGKWLDIDYGVNSVIGKERTHNNQFAQTPFNVPSYLRLFNDDGSRAYYTNSRFNIYNTIAESRPELQSALFNHMDELERDFINTSTLNTRYYLNLNIKPFDGLSLQPMFQYEDIRTDVAGYSEEDSYTMRWLHNVYTYRYEDPVTKVVSYPSYVPKGGKLATSHLRSPNYTARFQANFDRTFDRHRFIALAGMEFRQTRSYGTNGILLGYDDQLQTQLTNTVNFDAMDEKKMGTLWNVNYPLYQYHFAEAASMGLQKDIMHRFASGYANLTYTYDRKYNLFGSLRKDYADLFGGDEKYRGRPLWSVGASWVASNENFIGQYPWVNYLKLRTSYGLTGNIRNVSALLVGTAGINNLTQEPNATVSNPPNPQLRWEKTATMNIGIDFSILDNRLKGTMDWYHRKGTDLFAQKRLDPSEGFSSMVINNASMVNKGLEFNLSYDWFRPSSAGTFGWTSNLTGSYNKNRIVEVDELTRNPITLAGGDSYRKGFPVNSLFSFRFAGLDDMGMAQWYNTAGVATKTTLGPDEADAVVFSGSSDPVTTIGFNNDFSYKGFTLSIFTMYYGGHYFRARPVPVAYQSAGYGALPSYLLDSWTPENTDTDIPGSGQYYQIAPSNQYYYSDNLVRRADFLKIRNIALGYLLPTELAARIRAKNIRLRFQLNNPRSLWTRQNDVHIDAETGGAPVQTSFVFGINANF